MAFAAVLQQASFASIPLHMTGLAALGAGRWADMPVSQKGPRRREGLGNLIPYES